MAIKTVAVIGAGVSGLTAVKACLEQGLDVTCYEMHNDIGGLWYYTEHLRLEEGATVYEFMIANTSREMMRYSDFRFPAEAATFPSHREVHAYLHSYADHFGINSHVQLNTKVISLQKSENHSQNGRWTIVTQRHGENKQETKEFDGVILSCGFHRTADIPDIEGFSNFKGEWSHSKTFKNVKPFIGKRVLIIGNANSAIDISTGIADSAQQVYLSVGRGCWVGTRITHGITFDTYLFRRMYNSQLTLLDWIWRNVCEENFNHSEYGIRPSTSPLCHYPTVSEDMAIRVASGKIKIIPRVVRFFADGVQLDDGTEIKNIDHVVFGTGFKEDNSFLDMDTVLNSYKRTFPVNDEKPTLALVGLARGTGPHFPLAEMQARYAALVFAGKKKLPPKEHMATETKQWRQMNESFFGKGKALDLTLPLQDGIAKEIGVYPSFFKVFVKSPSVAFQTYFGPAFPAQNRLIGEGKSEEAFEDCKRAWELLTMGIKLRKVPKLKSDPMWTFVRQILYLFAIISLILAIYMAFYFK